MKKTMMATAIITLLMTMAVSMTSCTNDISDNPVTPLEPEQLAEYTILYYGHGGSSTDKLALSTIRDFYKADPDAYKKVNVVALYKFSTAENMQKQGFTDITCEYP